MTPYELERAMLILHRLVELGRLASRKLHPVSAMRRVPRDVGLLL